MAIFDNEVKDEIKRVLVAVAQSRSLPGAPVSCDSSHDESPDESHESRDESRDDMLQLV